MTLRSNVGYESLDDMAKILLKCVLGLASCIATLGLASPVVLSSDYNNSEVHPASKLLALNLEPTSPLNEPVTSLSVIGTDDTDIDCDGASYGFDLGIFDCEEAKTYFPAGSDQVLWAERNTGWQKKVFQLPYRAMGDRASCYLQPVLIDGATSAKASLNQVRNAAAMIRDKCASGGKLQGGIATNIGGSKTSCFKSRASLDRLCSSSLQTITLTLLVTQVAITSSQ